MQPEYTKCMECGNTIFDMKHRLFKVSALQSPSGQEELADIPVYICTSCGKEVLLDDPSNNLII